MNLIKEYSIDDEMLELLKNVSSNEIDSFFKLLKAEEYFKESSVELERNAPNTVIYLEKQVTKRALYEKSNLEIKNLENYIDINTEKNRKRELELFKTNPVNVIISMTKDEVLGMRKQVRDYSKNLVIFEKLWEYCKVFERTIQAEEKYVKSVSYTTIAEETCRVVSDVSTNTIKEKVEIITNISNRVLKRLFKDEPMVVSFDIEKTNRKGLVTGGNTVVFNVYNKGVLYEDISILCCGEQDRLSLALTIAMSLTFNSPFLLLDECMAGMDGDLRDDCIECLRMFFDRKTILNVCHETVKGVYDGIEELT